MEPSSPAASRPPEQPSSEPGTVAVQRASRLADLVEENDRLKDLVTAQDKEIEALRRDVDALAQKLEDTQDILGASEQELAVVSKRAAEFERTVASRAAGKEADLASAKADKADAEAVLRGLRAELVSKSTTIAAMDKHTREKSAEIVELKSQLDGKKAKAWILEQDLKERQIAHAARWKAWLDAGGQATCNVGMSLRLPSAVGSTEFTTVKNKVKSLGAKWDVERKLWYVPANTLLYTFVEWL